ncbi:MAG: TPM domain-containing protein [Bacteroidales bacterium]|jgi:uncharacterized membrane protein|nr:TPM domain-containing protein [Bacteroidales bacterium]
MNVRHFFSDDEKRQIMEAICAAELLTSGEIRVHIEESCPVGPLNRAAYWFAKLKMHKTRLRNGVLFYMAVKARQFAIIGDAGINARVAPDFWDGIRAVMAAHFGEGHVAHGLAEGIRMAGDCLKTYFPRSADDINELPDEISFNS